MAFPSGVFGKSCLPMEQRWAASAAYQFLRKASSYPLAATAFVGFLGGNPMLDHRKRRFVLSLAFGTALLAGSADSHLAAQGTIGSILGIVTDSSGSVIPGATVT